MRRKILILFFVCVSVFITTASAGIAEPNWIGPNIPQNPTDGCYGFEDGIEGAVVQSQIPGVVFSTTLGNDWLYVDFRTGTYNPSYGRVGNFVTWLGVSGDQGRIDFTDGTATYLSALFSTPSQIQIDAYDENDVLVDSAVWIGNNLDTGTMTRLTVQGPNIKYVIVHDSGNYWCLDEICSDAPGFNPGPSPVPEFPSFFVPLFGIVGMMAIVFAVRSRR
jgi:hypothetical protein